MKNIEQRSDSSFRAHVYRLGIRRSATFRTLGEAEAWVAETKWKLRANVGGDMLSPKEVMAMPRERPVCGVYFLFKGDALVYVGQSRNVYERVIRHNRRLGGFRGKFDSFSVLRCDKDKLNFLERYYIDLMKPPLNVNLPKFYRGKAVVEADEMAKLQQRAHRVISENELPAPSMNSGAEGAATSIAKSAGL